MVARSSHTLARILNGIRFTLAVQYALSSQTSQSLQTQILFLHFIMPLSHQRRPLHILAR
jgi:hypothetical protein